MKFRATILLGGKTATGIPVPSEVVESLGSKRPAVRVKIKEHSYRTTVAPMGGQFFIPPSAEHRTSAGVAAGDEVDVDIELDTEPREVSVPADFREALDQDPEARAFFDGLSYSNRLRLALAIEGAKAADTRQRRIEKTVGLLREGRV